MKILILIVNVGIALMLIIGCIQKCESSPYYSTSDLTLYQPNSVLQERIGSADALAAYLSQVQEQLAAFWAVNKQSRPVAGSIVVGLKPPSQSRFWLILSVENRLELQASLNATMIKLLAPPIKGGGVAVAINFTLGNISAPVHDMEHYTPPMPEEWRVAIANMTEPEPLPDGIFKRIWNEDESNKSDGRKKN